MGNSNRSPRSSNVSVTSSPRSNPSVKQSIPIRSSVPLALAPHVFSDSSDLECPICFSNYTALNTTKCCKQHICTGCYNLLLTKSPSDSGHDCPYCGQSKFTVKYDAANNNNTNTTMKSNQSKSESIRIEDSNKQKDKSNIYVPTASVNDRKSIEEEILKSQRLFREEISSSSSNFYSRSYDQYRSSDRSRLQTRARSGSNQGIATSSSATSSLAERLERLLLYYNGNHPDDDQSDSYHSDDLGPSLGDGPGNGRVVASFGDSQLMRRTPERSSMSSSSPGTFDVTDNLLESVFGSGGSRGSRRQLQTVEELEELMILEAMRLSLVESSPATATVAAAASATNVSTESEPAANIAFSGVTSSSAISIQNNVPQTSQRHDDNTSQSISISPSSDVSDEEIRFALQLSMQRPAAAAHGIANRLPVESADDDDIFGDLDFNDNSSR